MAVRKGDQEEGKLRALNAARIMVDYTYNRVHDKNICPKNEKWLLIRPIWENAMIAQEQLSCANDIRVETKADAEERLLLEKKAIGHMDVLLANIDILNLKGMISDDRAEYWSKLVKDTKFMTQALLKANRASYKKFLKDDDAEEKEEEEPTEK